MRKMFLLVLSLSILAGPACSQADVTQPLDTQVAGQRVSAIEQTIGTLSASLRAPQSELTGPDQEFLEAAVAQLESVAHGMRGSLAGGADQPVLASEWSDLLGALGRVERAGETAKLTHDQWNLLSGIRWNVRQLGLVLMVSGTPPTFVVGPMSTAQAGDLDAGLDLLARRSAAFAAHLQSEPGDITYRQLLLSQMDALAPPCEVIRNALTIPAPWWTFEANQAVTRILRVIALTRNETRLLPPAAMDALEALWAAADQVRAATNTIEGGARDAGPDAVMVYRPIAALRASR